MVREGAKHAIAKKRGSADIASFSRDSSVRKIENFLVCGASFSRPKCQDQDAVVETPRITVLPVILGLLCSKLTFTAALIR